MSVKRSILFTWWLRSLFIFGTLSLCIHRSSATETPESPSVGKLRSAADVAFTNGQYEQALDMWAKVIALEPNNDANFYKRFRVYLRQQKLKEAFADLNYALKLNPKNEGALVQRAKLALRLGKCEESEHDFTAIKR